MLDYLAIGVHELASMSERRMERLVNPGNLAAFLFFAVLLWSVMFSAPKPRILPLHSDLDKCCCNREVFKWLSKVITPLRLVIGSKISRQFFPAL